MPEEKSSYILGLNAQIFFFFNLNKSEIPTSLKTSSKTGDEKQNPRSLHGLNKQPCGLRPWQGLLQAGGDNCDPGRGLGTDPPHLHINTRKSEPWFMTPPARFPRCLERAYISVSVKTLPLFNDCHLLAIPMAPKGYSAWGQEDGW